MQHLWRAQLFLNAAHQVFQNHIISYLYSMCLDLHTLLEL